LSLAISTCGALGSNGFPRGGVAPNAPISLKKITVFKAAPFSCTICGFNVHGEHLNAPPAYDIAAASIVHPVQLMPSKAWVAPVKLERNIGAPNGGMVGSLSSKTSAVWANKGCSKVTVWLPKESDPSATPRANDPNAKATLVITTPPSGKAGNCSVWEYPYGEPPPLKVPPHERTPIIRPNNRRIT